MFYLSNFLVLLNEMKMNLIKLKFRIHFESKNLEKFSILIVTITITIPLHLSVKGDVLYTWFH